MWAWVLTLRSSGQLPAAAYLSSLVPSYSALCRPAFIPALRLSQRFLFGGFGALLGFACMRCAGFRPFGPPALVQQALPTIILAALRRFRRPALFCGLRPCPSPAAPFWPAGLTLRSSGLAFSQPLILSVSPLQNRFMQASLYSSVSPFSKVQPFGFGPCSGLRLQVLCGFQAFLASSARPACAGSSFFGSVSRVRSAFSNPSGLTRRSSRSAFGGRLTSFVSLRKTRIIQAHGSFTGIHLLKRLSAGVFAVCRASPWGAALVSSLFGL